MLVASLAILGKIDVSFYALTWYKGDNVAGKYDQAMKLVVAADPYAMVKFILRYADVNLQADGITVVAMLNTEFEGYEVEADGLLLLRTRDGEEFLLHIEFQSSRDTTMPDRQLEYCLRARTKHGPLPIISCVIYLRKDGNMPEPTLCWQLHNGQKLLLFDYVCIKLWELTREELLALKQPALLPLALLTKDNIDRTMVKEMFQSLLDNRLQDLCLAGEIFAALVLKEDDLAWLKQELLMMTDLFKDSPAYYWLTDHVREEGLARGLEQGREQGREEGLARGRAEGREEGREQGLEQGREEGLRWAVLSMISGRFPTVARLAKKQLTLVQHVTPLEKLCTRIGTAQTAAEVKQYLVEAVDESIQLE